MMSVQQWVLQTLRNLCEDFDTGNKVLKQKTVNSWISAYF